MTYVENIAQGVVVMLGLMNNKLSIFTVNINNNTKSKEGKEPLELKIAINRKKFELFRGKHVKMNKVKCFKQLGKKQEILGEMLKPKNHKTIFGLPYNGEYYMCVNKFEEGVSKKKLLLAIDALEMTFKFNCDCIETLEILDAYSLTNDNKDLAKGMKFNMVYNVGLATEIKIPIIYCCVSGCDMSLNLPAIHELKQSKRMWKDIKLSKPEATQASFIEFKETCYKLRCTRLRGDSFEFSLYLTVGDDNKLEYRVMESSFFEERKEIKKKSEKNKVNFQSFQ